MALTPQEAVYARAMILHGNRHKAIHEAFPKLERGFEQAALRYMDQNPEVRNHIDAGILHFFRDIVTHTVVPQPRPLTTEEKKEMLRLVIEGKRETPLYFVEGGQLKLIFAEPDEETIAQAKNTLLQMDDSDAGNRMIA